MKNNMIKLSIINLYIEVYLEIKVLIRIQILRKELNWIIIKIYKTNRISMKSNWLIKICLRKIERVHKKGLNIHHFKILKINN